MNIVPVILCGGSGERLWPLSRDDRPKQFLDELAGSSSLFSQTLDRLARVGTRVEKGLLVCNRGHRHLAREQLGGRDVRMVLEPCARNTAPAAIMASLILADELADDDVVVLCPSDHYIHDAEAFGRSVRMAASLAADGRIVTLGIEPDRPETGFGYIRAGEPLSVGYEIDRFVEKPDLDTAGRYLADGGYFWNSGMFVFRPTVLLEEAAQFASSMLEACRAALAGSTAEDGFISPDAALFEQCPSDSIDYAIMEHTRLGAMIPLESDWTDAGSWSAIYELGVDGPPQNRVSGNVIAEGCSGNFVRAERRLIAMLGLEDCVVVETADALLLASMSEAHNLKTLVRKVRDQQPGLLSSGGEVQRPWGNFESLEVGGGYQVKRLSVKPGGILSLQSHKQRSEHWIVVAGEATIHLDGEVFKKQVNEAVFVPVGAKHRIQNEGTSELIIVEVQLGSYLGEDDIIRYEDNYGRAGEVG